MQKDNSDAVGNNDGASFGHVVAGIVDDIDVDTVPQSHYCLHLAHWVADLRLHLR